MALKETALTVAFVVMAVYGCAQAGGQASNSPGAPTQPAISLPTPRSDATAMPSPGPGQSDPLPTTPPASTFSQSWATTNLTDVTTGESFTLAGLAAEGRVVFVEPIAIWCSNCRSQQRVAVDAVSGLDPGRFAWVGLDVEPSESADALARYRVDNAFPFRYAVADRDVARALADEFGDLVLSPPSVNLIILGTDGQITHLTGQHTADELRALAAAHGV